MERKNCDALSGISGPGRGSAGGPQPLLLGTRLPDQNGWRFEGQLIGTDDPSLVQSQAFNSDQCLFVLPYCGFIPSENRKMEEAVKTVSNVSTYTTGA